MLEDVLKVALPCQKISYVRDDLSPVGGMDAGNQTERYGYSGLLITRPSFYDVLLSRVPPHKVKWGKRILSFEQNQYGVMVRIADGSTFHGDILIGAGKKKVGLASVVIF
jgi:2-polyprenyl-6-methoxyphenol hydroxylase-like FAD-dependent oxidoreductase